MDKIYTNWNKLLILIKNKKLVKMKSVIFLSQENVKQVLLLIFILILYLLGKLNGNNGIISKSILIEVDTALENRTGGGPINLQRGISKALPYKTKNCQFIKMKYPQYGKKNIDYFYFSYPTMGESTFNELKKYNRTFSFPLIISGKREDLEKFYNQLKELSFIQKE